MLKRTLLTSTWFSLTAVIAAQYGHESNNSGWQINVDNDLLTGQRTDRDYTGGIAFTLSGKRVTNSPVSIDSWRARLDKLFNFPALFRASDYMSFHSQQYGMTLFTPDDISNITPVYDDRPYASLFFLSNTEFSVAPDKNTAYVSILTIGFLGLDIAEQVQGALHSITDSEIPNGWAHQISSGGEPTAMLTYGIQNQLYSSAYQQFKFEYEANLGYITDINAGFSWRLGKIHSPWWTYNPYQSKYMQQSMPLFSDTETPAKNESYLWLGGRINLRAYNALLQGQFRHSEVTISNKNLQRLVAEYWFGATHKFLRTYSASIFLRGLTDEYNGANATSSAWVGLTLSRTY